VERLKIQSGELTGKTEAYPCMSFGFLLLFFHCVLK